MVALIIRCILSTSRAVRLSLGPVRVLVSVRNLGLDLAKALVLGRLAGGIRARPIGLRPILVGCIWLERRPS